MKAGETVSLSGVVLQMPKAMKSRVNMPAGGNDDIYVYATDVNKRQAAGGPGDTPFAPW